MKSLALFIACTVLVPVTATAQERGIPLGSDVDRAVQTITPEDVYRRIGVLAHDSMRGRDTPSPELDKTAAWIASEFRSLGLRAGGDGGGYIQNYPLREVRIDTRTSRVEFADGTSWRLGQDASRLFGSTGPEGVRAPAVAVVGRADDAARLAQLPIEGKVVLWVLQTTDGGRPDFQFLNQAFGVISEKDPAAVVLVMDGPEARWRQALASISRVSVQTAWSDGGRMPLVEVRSATAAPVLSANGINLELSANRPMTARELADPVTVVAAMETLREMTAPNVVGWLEGSDPALRDEYIVYSAHMDHVGVGSPVAGDSIYNGADDDASGTAGIMEVAEAFAALEQRPRRSIIFLTVSGEEHGLWGSEYFANNPPVPMEQIVANLNADMIGRNWADTIVVIGKEHSDLGETLNRVNRAHPELDMTAIDDIWPEERFYYRSDHFNFARNGVPVLFFFNGTHDDYHRPSDEVERIDAEKESRIVKLLFYLGYDVANRTERPQWNPDSYREIVGTSR